MRSLKDELDGVIGAYADQAHRNNKVELVSILIHSKSELIQTDYNSWNEGHLETHRIILNLDSDIFARIVEKKEQYEKQIFEELKPFLVAYDSDDLSDVKILPNIAPTNWRDKYSSLTTTPTVVFSVDEIGKIWNEGSPRIFISHRSEHKSLAHKLKIQFEIGGFSAFVAHDDIEPTKEWLKTIEAALLSMDVLVALIDEEFPKSDWTDQEVGAAIGRGIRVVSVDIGKNPYGFIGKYQSLKGTGIEPEQLAKEISRRLVGREVQPERANEDLIYRFEHAGSFAVANKLMKELEEIELLSDEQIDRLEKAPDANNQVAGAFDVKERLPKLVEKLRRKT